MRSKDGFLFFRYPCLYRDALGLSIQRDRKLNAGSTDFEVLVIDITAGFLQNR